MNVSWLSPRCCIRIYLLIIIINNNKKNVPSSDVIMVTGSEGLETPTPFSATILKWYVVAG